MSNRELPSARPELRDAQIPSTDGNSVSAWPHAPWKWVDAEDGRSDLVAADGHVIIDGADLLPRDPVNDHGRDDLLIQAAPEMLELLRDIDDAGAIGGRFDRRLQRLLTRLDSLARLETGG